VHFKHTIPLVIGAWLGVAPLGQAQEKITYQDHISPLFENACNSCHNADKAKGGLDLSSYANMLNGGSSGGAVEAGNPDGSLLLKLITRKEEPFMPHKKDKLEDAQIALVAKWITGGLLETKSSTAKKKKKAAFDLDYVAVTDGKPEGPLPMPEHLLLEPVVSTDRAGGTPALAANPWAPIVAVAGQKQALLYHTETLELLGVLPFERGFIESLTFSRNGQLLIAGGGRGGKVGGMVAWDIKTGRQRMTLGKEYDTVLAADMMADLTTVALGGPGKRIKMFELPTGEPLYNIKKHSDWVMAVSFSPDTVLLATGDRNGGLHVWESFTGNLFYTLNGHGDDITQLSWRLDSNVLASASEDGTVRLWEMINGKQVKSWTAHSGGTLSVQFNHNGDLVTVGRDKQVKIWDQNGKQKRAIKGVKSIPLEAVFTHDSKRVIVGEWNGSVTVWDAANGKSLGELSANPPTLAKRIDAAKRLAKATETDWQKATETHEQTKAKVTSAGTKLKKHHAAAKASSAAKQQAEKQLATAQTALGQAQTQLTNAKANVAKQNELQTNLLGEQDANTAALAKATTQLPGLSEQVGFLSKQLASLRVVQKQTDEKAKQDGAATALKAAAEKATEATQAMNAALKAAKAQHDSAIAQTKTLPDTIAARQKKIEKNAAETTLAQATQKTAQQQFNERNSQIDAAQKNVKTTTDVVDEVNKKIAATMASVDALKKKENEQRIKLEQATAAHNAATRRVAKWEAAQINVRRLGEKLALRELQAELESYTAATAEAKAKLSQTQAALGQAQQKLANVPTQTKTAIAKLQSQLDALGQESEKLDALGQLLDDRKAFQTKMESTADETIKLAATEPNNPTLAKAAKLLKETVTLLGKDIESVQSRLAAQQKTTADAKTSVSVAQKDLDQLKLLPEKLEADIKAKTEIAKAATENHLNILDEEKTFAKKVATQQAKTDKTSNQYFALLPK
jgi:mono/diheme cytochrome c family protein